MTPPLRIAALSAWHVHAEEYARAAQDHPETELVAVWDDDAERGADLAATLGVEFAPDLDALLARPDLDGVTITTATTDHSAVIGAAIAAGKHVFTEKLLAPTVAEAQQLLDAAREQDVAVVVSLPRLSHAYTVALRQVLDSGRLGRITYSRVRLAHDGSVADWLPARFYDPAGAIGGAFSDLGAHPVYLTQLILGDALAVTGATYTDMTGRGVEDNAVVTVVDSDGAIGVIETGFVSPASPFSIEVHGTEASVSFGLDGEDALVVRTRDGLERVTLPAEDPTPFEAWVQDIRTGSRSTDNQQRAVDLTALVVAANALAARTTTPEENA
ncbi:Gfo/Idh/MocA family protein [Brachybacterium sp. AOP25-B2-12]|uniref:Gfo/Idh/MocA family protein n=1 Tax=Brachybacterium sp. AOP25-B2-12 TaxID=3457710 RepID=UPI004034D4E1